MDSEGVSIPLIHEHIMMPWNDLRRGDCCGHLDTISDGYYCKPCDFFVHKKCGGEVYESIKHPSHPEHTLRLQSNPCSWCNLCRRDILNLSYHCAACLFDLDLYCAKYQPPEVIDSSETHRHKLTFLKEWIEFACAKCENIGREFHYVCRECELTFHIDCVWHPSDEKQPLAVNHPSEVSHSCHSLHPLKLFTGQPPDYSDGKCCLCGRMIGDELFYHCASCNFTLDTGCVLNPPLQYLLELKTHDHQLFLLPRLLSFTCNACGLKGDRSPYICVQCNFMIHKECICLPLVININRHDHRISRTSLLGVVNSVCGVCRKKVDWSCGGYSCQRCHGYVVHSKCATRNDVWNGKELEGVPEEKEDIQPYGVIDDNTIQHFSHKEHYLRLNVNGLLWEEKKHCNGCAQPICLQSFYGCMDCDFILHQNCAKLPRRIQHVLHNERLTLVVAGEFRCHACYRTSNGFMYRHGTQKLDVCCASIHEPFVHSSHPQHPLYYIPQEEKRQCEGCNKWTFLVLTCIEDNCGFVLCFGCATLPEVVKHRVNDHPLSICCGEKDASGKYWCDICEKETNPETWFYTCKDHQASLHTKCVLGEFVGLMPRSTILTERGSCEVVLNNSISRPFCMGCKSHCIPPIILKLLGTSDTYFCSSMCTWGR